MHVPSRQRRPKGVLLALGGGEEEEVVGRNPGQPRQGDLSEERQGRWAGVYPCVATPSLLSHVSFTRTPQDLPWERAGDAGCIAGLPVLGNWAILLPRGHGQRAGERGQICPYQLQ